MLLYPATEGEDFDSEVVTFKPCGVNPVQDDKLALTLKLSIPVS